MTSRIEVQKVGVRGFLNRTHETWKPDVPYKKVYWKVYIRLDSGLTRHLHDLGSRGEVDYFTKGLIDAVGVADYPF